jgi:hypothetical protein
MENRANVCEGIKSCPFFNSLHFGSTAETLKVLFCKSDWKKCERWKLKTTGVDVPVELWPNGFSRKPKV